MRYEITIYAPSFNGKVELVEGHARSLKSARRQAEGLSKAWNSIANIYDYESPRGQQGQPTLIERVGMQDSPLLSEPILSSRA